MTLFLFRSPSIVILTFVVILAVVDANSLYTVVIMAFNDNENDNSDTVNVETDSLISSSKKYETMEIHEIFQQTNSSSKGLTNIYARSIRKLHGLNKIKVAEDCPPWLCCLLGLKQQSKTAKLLEKCIPQSASVLRDGKYLLLDVESVVVGDIVRLSAGQSIPADIRIFEHSEDCQFDTAMLFPNKVSKASVSCKSPSMVFAGSRCIQGDCIGVVVATGPNTLISELLKKNLWPVTTSYS